MSTPQADPPPPEALRDAKILIIDDELSNVRFLEIVLQQAGYKHLQSTTDARTAVALYLEFKPDLLLLDLNMPHVSGFEIMAQLKPLYGATTYFPILVLTADTSAQTKRQALTEGAKDFLTKPLDQFEVILRIANLLETRFQHLMLETKVRERTADLAQSQLETLQRLARAAEYRDDDTGLHTKRVGWLAARLAEALQLSCSTLLQQAAPLHDVGKIGISDMILLKPGQLTREEFTTMQAHPGIGAEILSGSTSPLLQLAEKIALTHHEHWDGSGYPYNLAGDAIPIEGRIVAVADVFDALTHERPYKHAWPIEAALAEIQKQGGRQFDPALANAFCASIAHDMAL